MRSEDQIKQAVIELGREELQWEQDIPEGDLSEYLDSMKRLSLVVAIEDHWQICLEPEDEEEIRTLDDLVKVIHSALQEQEGAG